MTFEEPGAHTFTQVWVRMALGARCSSLERSVSRRLLLLHFRGAHQVTHRFQYIRSVSPFRTQQILWNLIGCAFFGDTPEDKYIDLLRSCGTAFKATKHPHPQRSSSNPFAFGQHVDGLPNLDSRLFGEVQCRLRRAVVSNGAPPFHRSLSRCPESSRFWFALDLFGAYSLSDCAQLAVSNSGHLSRAT